MNAEEFGAYLKTLRKAKGLTLIQLGELTGYSNPYLSQIENGKKGLPSPETLRKLSAPLAVEFSDLMVKAGHISLEDWSSAFIQEDFDLRDEVVYKRVKENQQNGGPIDLKLLLESNNDLKYNGWNFNESDRKKVLDMLAILFPTNK